MAPKNLSAAGVGDEMKRNDDELPEIEWAPHEVEPRLPAAEPVQTKIVWRNVVIFGFLHVASVYGLFLVPTTKPLTWLLSYLLFVMGALSITAGAHRLWSHRSYKARLPLRLMLVMFNLTAGQNHLIEWCRDHRVHHKYSETSADPHNAKRGFFFAHMGWLMCKKHPDVIAKGKLLDFSDLYADPLLRFQKRYYKPLAITFCFIIPTFLPMIWGESAWSSYFVAGCLRYCLLLHGTWLVNSAAHMWGMRPYDKNINPAENLLVTIGAIGEGFHNYHHTFPHDYSTSEFGSWLNPTTVFINLMAKMGWAYGLKTIPTEVILARMKRTGCLSETKEGSMSSAPLQKEGIPAACKKQLPHSPKLH